MEWTIKRVAEKTGISADTLRYYDKEGIVSPKRHENGYRYYNEADIKILKNLVVMKYVHFSLAEMKSIEELFRREPSVECNEISKQILKGKVTELKQTILHYQKIVNLMEAMLPMLENAETFRSNELQIDEFISQIFEDIRGYGKSLPASQNKKK
jgi:DNA-binding transcriptional MerR regulator